MMNPMNMIGQIMGGGNQGMNPMKIMQMMQKGGNPTQMMQMMFGNNPQYQRVMQMVKGKSPAEVRQVAMNLCEQRGVNFEQAMMQMREMGINVPDIENTPENAK